MSGGEMREAQTVVVGLSGGVDSAVTAYLLKEAGWRVLGVTLRTRDANAEEADAARVAEHLGISWQVLDVRQAFEDHVVSHFVAEYVQGRTPNPCIVCNPLVKFAGLLDFAQRQGAAWIATGHYARVAQYPETGRYCMQSSVGIQKDQTYALCGLTQDQLAHTLTPLGEYQKPQVREIALQAGLPVAEKPDSQEICFVPDDDYGAFLESRLSHAISPGEFIDPSGQVIGTHRGYIHYTIGQRKGLGMGFGARKYVLAIDPKTNRVTLGENADLFANRVEARDMNWQALPGLTGERRVQAKLRYAQKAAPATVCPTPDGGVVCHFDTPQRAATPGQTLALYDGPYLLGGGTIC